MIYFEVQGCFYLMMAYFYICGQGWLLDKRYGRIINSTGILNYIRKWGEYTMSAQTDCEMLAIRALENYATQHHITDEIMNLMKLI